MIAVYAPGLVLGLSLAIWASRRALTAATSLGAALGMSPFVIGMTIVAVGTDLPEIANSIIASATDRGDVNIGNSIGSVVTQITLVLGILCLTGKLRASRNMVVTAGSLTVLALLIGAVLIDDRYISRTDGALLIAVWLIGTLIIQRPSPRVSPERREMPERPDKGAIGRDLLVTGFHLGLVGAGAIVAVESFSRAASDLGAPEYLLSFFVLALGTSLPELVVDAQAIRHGNGELAMGDLLGSSFVDATLSPGIGPLLFPTVLSAGLSRGNVVVAVVVAVVTVVLARSREHRWPTGLVLIVLYLALYPALLA